MDDLEKTFELLCESDQPYLPERALWAAVIQRAYDDLSYYFENKKPATLNSYLTAKRARAWVLGNSEQLFSFRWCVNTVFGYYGESLELQVINRLREYSDRPMKSPNPPDF